MTYIGIIQGAMAQWVAMRPILEVCARDTGCEGGGLRREEWWRQEVPETQIRETLEETSWESSRRRRGDRSMQ